MRRIGRHRRVPATPQSGPNGEGQGHQLSLACVDSVRMLASQTMAGLPTRAGSWLLHARLDDEAGAELPLGQLEPRVAELLGQEGGDHQPRKGAVDVLLLLEDLELARPGRS